MNYLTIDYLIVYVFLLITLVIGLWAGRGIKDIREYVTANKTFGNAALVLTLLATYIAGACVMNDSALVFSSGIIMTVALLGVSISFLVTAFFIAPKVTAFGHCITMGDLMRDFYGVYSGIIAGVLGLLNAVLLAGMELIVLGLVCEALLGIQATWGIIIGGIGLAAYTAHGGIKSVIITDVFQFIVLAIFIPIIAYVAIDHVGGVKEVFRQVPQERLAIFSHKDFSFYLTLFLMWITPAGMIDPAIIQRLLLGKHGRELRDQYLVVAAFDPAFRLCIMLIGLAGLALYPTIEAKYVVPHIIHELLPIGIKGMAMAGVLAVGMSTIDSYLHAAGLTLVHDILHPICEQNKINLNELQWVRYATILISLAAIGIGLYATDILGLCFSALEFTSPLLMFPLLSGIMGLKPDKRSFYIALLVTLSTFGAAKLLLPQAQGHFTILISVLANGLSFFGVHWLQNKGFSIVPRKQGTAYIYKPQKEVFLTRLKECIPTPQRIVKYSQKQVKKYGAPYMLLGVFCCINYTLPYFMWPHQLTSITQNFMIWVRLIGAIYCALLIVKDKWPKSLLPYLPTFWHLTLLYCLPFTSTVMFLLTLGSVEWLINVAITIMFLIVLVDWMSFIILTVLGVTLGILFYKLAIGPIKLHLDFSTGYLLVYQGLFATLIGLIFARRKQKSFDALATQSERLASDHQEVQNELFEATEEKMRFVSLLKKAGIEQLGSAALLSKELLEISQQEGHNKNFTTLTQQLTDQLTPMALHLDKFSHRATGFLLLEGVKSVTVDKFLQAIQQALHAKGHKLKISLHTQHKMLQCDVAKMKKVIVNSFFFIQAVAGAEAPVLLGVEDTQLGYPLPSVASDHIKKVVALRFTITTTLSLPALQEAYTAQMDWDISEETFNMPLVVNERIVKAHYGYSSIISQGDSLTIVYVIPLNVREVRSKDMDIPQMKLGAEWPRADDTYPGAQEQELALLKAVKEKSKADLSLVEKAINLIKDYHGPIMRKSGEPFYLHLIAVAQIVLNYNQEEETILGALLHDTVEDTPLTLEQIEMLFNKEVRNIVSGVTNMESNKETIYKVLLSRPENIHGLLEEEDPRVLYVKLADRIHNMRTIQAKPYERQRRTAEETLLFFVPLAKYLGLTKAAEALKNMSWGVLGQNNT